MDVQERMEKEAAEVFGTDVPAEEPARLQRMRAMAEWYYQWMKRNNVTVTCNLPKKAT